MSNGQIEKMRQSEIRINDLKLKTKQNETDKDFVYTDYVLDVNAQGFIEEFYDTQRCHT